MNDTFKVGDRVRHKGPQIMNDTNTICPDCGSPAYQGMITIECTRLGCGRYKAPKAAFAPPVANGTVWPLASDDYSGRREQAHAPGSAPAAAEIRDQLRKQLSRASVVAEPGTNGGALIEAMASVFAEHFKVAHARIADLRRVLAYEAPHEQAHAPSAPVVMGVDVGEASEQRTCGADRPEPLPPAVRPRCRMCGHAKAHRNELRPDPIVASMRVCTDERGCDSRVRRRKRVHAFVQLPPDVRTVVLARVGGTLADELRAAAERYDANMRRRRAGLGR